MLIAAGCLVVGLLLGLGLGYDLASDWLVVVIHSVRRTRILQHSVAIVYSR